MPTVTRWYLKTALVYFVLALSTGVLLAVQQIWGFALPYNGIFPVYIHLLVVGWLTLLILGVAYWMFPKFSSDLPRGSETLGWASYILLNAGLALRLISEPANALAESPGSVWGILLVIAALLQWLGGVAFVANTWARVREK
jgi:hypothetical protein